MASQPAHLWAPSRFSNWQCFDHFLCSLILLETLDLYSVFVQMSISDVKTVGPIFEENLTLGNHFLKQKKQIISNNLPHNDE